jgi:TolB-like protein
MTEGPVQRRLAAIMVVDVVGYSRMMSADEAGTLSALRERRRAILEPVVKAHGGRIVKLMGDGALLEFGSAVKAVEAAVELQRKFAAANEPNSEEHRILLRIGINLGEVVGEGSDIYGEGVNIAARLEALAEPGGVCISAKVHDEVRGKVDAAFEDIGEKQLKNIAAPIRAFRIQLGTAPEMLRPALALPDKPSIAVLPFQNMSGDPEQDYFADGIVEEIITAISRMNWLFVIARNSSFTYKGRNVDVKQIGRELGVRYVLEGSVRKAGDKVRITGQLIDASNSVHLWADRFEGILEDIFDLQDQVTSSVIGAIAPKLEQAEIERSRRKPTESLDAYDHYLRGLAGVHLWTREANNEALAEFYKAIELDPGFATAYGMAARCYVQRKASSWVADRDAEVAEAERLARRSFELGQDDSVALCTAGIALEYVVGNPVDGEALINRAIELNPNLALAWLFSAWVKTRTGDSEESIKHVRQAMRLSPQDPQIVSMQACLATAHFIASRYAEALSFAETALRFKANYTLALCVAAAAAGMLNRQPEAQKAMTRLRQLEPDLRLSNLENMIPTHRPDQFALWGEGLRRAGLPD